MEKVGRWSFIGGIILAVIAGFFTIPYAMTILVVLGLIVGLLNVTAKESQKYLIAVIALMVVGTASIQALSVLGNLYGVTETILTNAIAFVAASGFVVAVKEVVAMGHTED